MLLSRHDSMIIEMIEEVVRLTPPFWISPLSSRLILLMMILCTRCEHHGQLHVGVSGVSSCVCTTGLQIVYLFFETSCNFHLLFEKNPESENRAQKDDNGK